MGVGRHIFWRIAVVVAALAEGDFAADLEVSPVPPRILWDPPMGDFAAAAAAAAKGDFAADVEVPSAPPRILSNPPMGDFAAPSPPPRILWEPPMGDFPAGLGVSPAQMAYCRGGTR